MKLTLLTAILCGFAFQAAAQVSPLSVTTTVFNDKKSAETMAGMQPATGGGTAPGRALMITIRNTSFKPLQNVELQWCIFKQMTTIHSGVGGSIMGQREAPTVAESGAEAFNLRPGEQKIVRTTFAEAERGAAGVGGYRDKAQIIGHVVQLALDGKIVNEEVIGPAYLKKAVQKVNAEMGAKK